MTSTVKRPAESSEATSEPGLWALRGDLFGLELVARGEGERVLQVLASEFPEGPRGPRLLSGRILIEVFHSLQSPPPPRPLIAGARLAGFLQHGEHLWLRTKCGTDLYGDAKRGVGRIHATPATVEDVGSELGSGLGMLLSHLLRGRGLYTVHAAAVRAAAGTLLICGPSGSGKSTAAAILAASADFSLLADDRVMLADFGGDLAVLPYPTASSLRSPMAGLIPHAPVGSRIAPSPPAALFFPSVRLDGPTELDAINRMASFRTLLGASVVPSPSVDEHFRLVSRLARETPAYALRLGSGWTNLPSAVNSVLARLSSVA